MRFSRSRSLGVCLSGLLLLLGASLSLLGNRGGGGNAACSVRFLNVSSSSVSFSCSLHHDLQQRDTGDVSMCHNHWPYMSGMQCQQGAQSISIHTL